jgi:hypothetical protein
MSSAARRAVVIVAVLAGVALANLGGSVDSAMAACSMSHANITSSNDPNAAGAFVNYGPPTVTGTCGTITCSPASGSFFPLGTTTVTCTSSAGPDVSFSITVNDTQPPTITVPANITRGNDPNFAGANVTYPAPTVSDNAPGVSAAVCNHPSASFFPLGTTTVTCTTTDKAGNTATGAFTVRVNDTQAPTVLAPSDRTVDAPAGSGGTNVDYPPPSVSDNAPGATVSCAPASGSRFSVGTTTVTCTAHDAASNTSTATFKVTVNELAAPSPTPAGSSSSAAAAVPLVPPDTVPPLVAGCTTSDRITAKAVTVCVRSSEDGPITVGGRLSIPGRAATVRLATVNASARARQPVTLVLAVPSKSRSAVGRALKRHRRVVATLQVSGADGAGNASAEARRVIAAR